MDNRSSTSNSEPGISEAPDASQASGRQWPTAALLALVLVLIADSWLLGIDGPWEHFRKTTPRPAGQHGIIKERLSQRAIRDREPGRLGVVAMGSSRTLHGFDHKFFNTEGGPNVLAVKIARPSMGPFEILSASDEMLPFDPDVAVIYISEFDTHRPLILVPKRTSGELRPIVELALETGPSYVFRKRSGFYRTALVGFLNSYRYRDLLDAYAIDRYRRFSLDDRFDQPKRSSSRQLGFGGRQGPASRARLDEQIQKFLPLMPENTAKYRSQIAQLWRIHRGYHVAVQESMVRRAVKRWVTAGKRVILVEAPLHPIAGKIYDQSISKDFLIFVDQLQQELDVEFMPLSAAGPYSENDFLDLTHLNTEASQRLTLAILRQIEQTND